MHRANTGYNQNYGPSHSNSGAGLVEKENEALENDLKNKVKQLKKVTIDIGHEVRGQNKYIGDLDNDFDKSAGFLKSTMNRVTRLARSGNFCTYLYLLLFAAFVFFMIWIITKTR